MKTWMKVVLGMFAGLAAIIGLVFWLTGDITKTGDQFFAAVRADDMDAAYALLSDDFKAGTSQEELARYLSRNALDKVTSVSWGGRSISNNMGSVNGTAETESGGAIPISLALVNGADGWKIYGIEKKAAGLSSSNGPSLPSPEEQERLFVETVRIFGDAVAEGHVQKLYDHSSRGWQKEVSVDQMNTAFASGFKYADVYVGLRQRKPVMDSVRVSDESGAMILEGHYPLRPKSIYFKQLYVQEGLKWKLEGFGFNVGAPVE